MTSYLGSVLIHSPITLDEAAEAINKAFSEFRLYEEDTGRFEECPAFVYKNEQMEIVLAGNPEDTTEFVPHHLKIRIMEVDPVRLFQETNSRFLKEMPAMQAVADNEYINISQYICDYIQRNTELECRAAWIS